MNTRTQLKINWQSLADEIDAAPRGSKRALVEAKAATLGVSADTIYRNLRRRFGKKKEIKRKPKIDQDLIDMVADLKLKAMQEGLGEREISTQLCIDLLVSRGVPGADTLKASSVNRRLEQSGFRMRDPKIRYEAQFANHEHQIDFSRSKYFNIKGYDRERGDYIVIPTGRSLYYKQGADKFRLWLVGVTDSYSRLRLVKAYGATGESGILGLEFLKWCYGRPEDDHPMRYVPVILKSDNGSFEKKKEVRSAMDALGIDSRRSQPYNKDSQGKIERSWRTLWQRFEAMLALKMSDDESSSLMLSEYNDLLFEYLLQEMRMAHPIKTNEVREDLYRKSILAHPPGEVDADIIEMACRVFYRKVGQDLMVKLEGEQYEAPTFAIDQRIRVHRNMYGEVMGELVDVPGKPFKLKAFRYRDIDDFEHRHAATYRQERKRILKGEAKDKQAPKAAPRKEMFMPPRPEKVKIDSVFAHQETDQEFPSVFAAREYIGERLPAGSTYADYEDVFDGVLSKTLERWAINTLLEGINTATAANG